MLRLQVCSARAPVRNARFARVSACSKLRRATASANRRACRRRDSSSHPVHAMKMIPLTSPINSRSIPRIVRIPSQISPIAPHLPPVAVLAPSPHRERAGRGPSAHAGLSSSVTSAFGSVPATHRSSSRERERCSTHCQPGKPAAIDHAAAGFLPKDQQQTSWFASDFVTQIERWISQHLLGLLTRGGGGGADHVRPAAWDRPRTPSTTCPRSPAMLANPAGTLCGNLRRGTCPVVITDQQGRVRRHSC